RIEYEAAIRKVSTSTDQNPHLHSPLIIEQQSRHSAATLANMPASELIRRSAIAAYSGLSSIRIALRPKRSATMPVVPAPPKGSSIVQPSGQPAKMHGSIRDGGK